jgi:hypothetical protein
MPIRNAVIASEAKQSKNKRSVVAELALDCFVADAPRNDVPVRHALKNVV